MLKKTVQQGRSELGTGLRRRQCLSRSQDGDRRKEEGRQSPTMRERRLVKGASRRTGVGRVRRAAFSASC